MEAEGNRIWMIIYQDRLPARSDSRIAECVAATKEVEIGTGDSATVRPVLPMALEAAIDEGATESCASI